MGLWDRDYYRDEQDSLSQSSSGFSLKSMTWIGRIVLVNVLLYFVDALFFGQSTPLMERMAVRPDTWVHPLTWWRFLTSGFAHDPHNVSHLVFNMLGLWMLGRRVEQRLGGREFLGFYLVAVVFGSLVWTAAQALAGGAYAEAPIMLGASGAVTAVVMLFVFFFPHERLLLMMVIPVPAWVVGVIIVVTNLSGATHSARAGEMAVAYEVHLAGAVLAFLYFRRRWNFSRWLPTGWPTGRGGGAWSFRRPPRLRVHRGGDEDRDLAADYAALDAEGDRILAKLHEQGDASLTPQDRKILEDYMRRMRRKYR